MPLGTKSGTTPPGTATSEKPVVFQKYFKNGTRTYASQVKISSLGKKYLVLTEGHRDPETQELKKHTLCVFEQDLKQFFAILQETVLYLRSNKDPVTPPAGAAPATPANAPTPSNGTTKPAKPPIATRTPANGANGNGAKPATIPSRQPAPVKPATKPAQATKAPQRPTARPQPAAPARSAPKNAYRPGTRSNGR